VTKRERDGEKIDRDKEAKRLKKIDIDRSRERHIGI
jgi:hypothetical protein